MTQPLTSLKALVATFMNDPQELEDKILDYLEMAAAIGTGITEGTPQDIIAAAIEMNDGSAAALRVLRHVVEQGTRAQTASAEAKSAKDRMWELAADITNVVTEMELYGSANPTTPDFDRATAHWKARLEKAIEGKTR